MQEPLNLAVDRNRQEIERCIRERRLLRFQYKDGAARIVEPHVVGINAGGAPALLAWLCAGQSSSGDRTGWRQYRLDAMVGLERLADEFAGPRESFKEPRVEFKALWCSINADG